MKSRMMMTLLAVAAVCVGVGPAQAFQTAPPGVYQDTYYWYDVAETQLAGRWREYCDGSFNGYGYITEYGHTYTYEC